MYVNIIMGESVKTETGTIMDVSAPKTSVKGDSYIRIMIGSEWFSMWNPSDDLDLSVGDKVKFSYVLQGKFRNIKKLEICGTKVLGDKCIDAGKNSDMPVDFVSASSIDPNRRIDDDLREIKYKLSLILEILRQKFDIDIE